MKVAIQFAARAQLCVAPTASAPTSSLARMNGTGPRPTAKEATKSNVATAERILMLWEIPSASRTELMAIPVILRRRQVLRPMRSGRGVQRIEIMTFKALTATVTRAAPVGRSAESMLTEYMTILLIPVSCCAIITMMTAKIAGRYVGLIKAANIPTETDDDFGFGAGRESGDSARRDTSSASIDQ